MLHKGCITLHRGCIMLHRGCIMLHRGAGWLAAGWLAGWLATGTRLHAHWRVIRWVWVARTSIFNPVWLYIKYRIEDTGCRILGGPLCMSVFNSCSCVFLKFFVFFNFFSDFVINDMCVFVFFLFFHMFLLSHIIRICFIIFSHYFHIIFAFPRISQKAWCQ